MLRKRVYDSIVDTCFDTPLVALRSVRTQPGTRILLKCEFFNPMASVKDRIARAMLDRARTDGSLQDGATVIEPTSGNTGIALAFACAGLGHPLVLVMPESMSMERRVLLRSLGAELVLTPAADGMPGAVAEAERRIERDPSAWMPQQFDNPANPDIHEKTTGPEIWADTNGDVDVFVAGVGTGGTITGVTRYLRTKNPNVKAIAVEPDTSAVLSGRSAGPHRIQGIGAGFVPSNLDVDLLDRIETVSSEEAFQCARDLARKEGIYGGISTGANVAVAARLAGRPEYQNQTIVTVACSFGERYLSTPLFDGHWG